MSGSPLFAYAYALLSPKCFAYIIVRLRNPSRRFPFENSLARAFSLGELGRTGEILLYRCGKQCAVYTSL